MSDVSIDWFRPCTHGNVFLRFCIVYCSHGNGEHPTHYLKQYKNAGKRFRVYGGLIVLIPYPLHIQYCGHLCKSCKLVPHGPLSNGGQIADQ